MTEEEQKTWNVVIKYSDIIASVHKGGPLLFFIFTFSHDLHRSLHMNTENTPNLSFKIPYSVQSCWMKNSCLHPKWDWLFQVKKKKTLEIVFKWKMYRIANIPSAWCLSKRRTAVACYGTSLNTVFWYKSPKEYFRICCSVSHFIYSKCKKHSGNQTWACSKIYGRITSGLHFEMDPWHELVEFWKRPTVTPAYTHILPVLYFVIFLHWTEFPPRKSFIKMLLKSWFHLSHWKFLLREIVSSRQS